MVFDGDIDGTTVAAADFLVDSVTPSAAEWFSGQSNSVFLTVPAMAANTTPSVGVVFNSVSDVAGNANLVFLSVAAARDGIAPTLIVTLTGDTGASGVPLGNSSAFATITTNETLLGVPVVKVAMVAKATESATADHFELDAAGTLTAIKFATPYTLASGAAMGDNAGNDAMAQPAAGVTFIAADTWEKRFTATEFLPAGGGSLYAITVEANDVAGNSGKAGSSDPIAQNALLFELDRSLPSPVVPPPATSSAPTRSSS